MPISGDLLKLQREIQGYADDYGLDYFPQIFEICDYDTINILAANEGFPNRYPHWRFGMQYDQLSKGYRYGLQKIYEMVINTNPCYAYLLHVNNWLDQKLVMAHVYGHNDFFKNNLWFKNTNRNMMDVMANNGTKIRRYIEKYGVDRVETFIDRVLSLENLLDVNVLFETVEVAQSREQKQTQAEFEKTNHDGFMFDDRSQALKSFMRSSERSRVEAPVPIDLESVELPEKLKNQGKGERDILRFLIDYAPLEEWEADIIGCLRAESYYFLPQRMTKIMNEGWASYWHSTILTQKALKDDEVIDFADKHAGVMVMSKKNINPYKVGIELMRDIEFRWNTGRFGKEYQECTNMKEKENWNLNTNLGREKIFEVRRSHNDLTFIDEFLTPEFCERQQLFTYKYNPRTHRMEVDRRDFQAIKQKLLIQLTNFGSPLIFVEEANYRNRSELLLKHRHDGVDLDLEYARQTMRNLYFLWKRPVNLATIAEEKEVVHCYDGKEFKTL
jgi:stage V sporulation protein R